MRIQHNIMALNAYRQLGGNNSALSKNLEKLSSGYRINRAGDDAAGLAISEKMRAQIKGLEAAQKNANDGISLVQTGEGALTEVHSMLNRMVYLATQSANGTYDNETDRYQLQKELNQLRDEIDRIADGTNFNGIKLLDGKSLSGQLSKLPVEYHTTSMVDGIEVEGGAGKGTKGTFTLDLQGLHGTGDTITFAGTDISNQAINITLTYGNTTDNQTFTGATLEEQAESIKNALKMNGNIASGFDVSVDGTKVTLTALKEGTEDVAKLTSIKSTDKTCTLGADTVTDGVAGTVMFSGGWDGLFSSDGTTTSVNGVNVQVGDKLTFNLKGNNGEDLSATIEITADMLGTDGKVSTLTANVAEKLMNAKFDDVAATGIDESNLKVSDLFTVNANKNGTDGAINDGAFQLIAKNGGLCAATNMQLKRDGVTISTVAPQTAGTPGAATTAVAEKHVVAAGTNNFSAGDEFKISGKLSDGQEFSVSLIAGKDFEIGTGGANAAADYITSMNNIVTALTGADSKVKVDVDGKKVDANKIFGAATTTAAAHDFKVSANAGALTIESTKAGAEGVKGVAGDIASISLKTAPAAESKYTSEAAVAQQSASTTITIDKNLSYGTAIKVGDNTYEIVSDARNVTDRRNVAVVIDDIANASTSTIAQALKEAIDKEDGAGSTDPKYDVTSAGNSVTINTVAKGSDVEKINVDFPYGEEKTTATFQFDPNAVKEGSILKFNGQTYQFVKQGDKATEDGAIAINVDNFKTADAKALGEAFKAVVKNGVADVAADGTVTLSSLPNGDGEISRPSVVFDNSLTLQIGDTADSYNQLTVRLRDMHTSAMGIDEISIADPTSAQNAIDTIRSAINYVSDVRGDLGAIQNRLEHTINNLGVQAENITAAESRIRDTDMAEEMMAYTKNNILVQAAQAMLAQANQVPQGVLQLLQ